MAKSCDSDTHTELSSRRTTLTLGLSSFDQQKLVNGREKLTSSILSLILTLTLRFYPLSFFFFFDFSLYFHFSFSFSFFLFLFVFSPPLLQRIGTKNGFDFKQVRGNFLSLSNILFFFSFFFLRYFGKISSSHSYPLSLSTCHASSSYGAMWQPHSYVMWHPTPRILKNVKFILSQNSTKFDWVARFRETNSTVKSVSSSEI